MMVVFVGALLAVTLLVVLLGCRTSLLVVNMKSYVVSALPPALAWSYLVLL